MEQRWDSGSRLDAFKYLAARAERLRYRVGAVAKCCGVSARQFQRLTSVRFGMVPHALLAHIRFAHGVARLKGLGLVKQASIEAGFKHPADFTRFFEHYWGRSPGTFREAALRALRASPPRRTVPKAGTCPIGVRKCPFGGSQSHCPLLLSDVRSGA